jgi:hypothetical protein
MIRMTGIQNVVAAMKAASLKIHVNIDKGLVSGGHLLQTESQRICPVYEGHLRASAFTRKIWSGHVVVGYTADYAAYVHENLNAAHGKEFNIKHADKIAKAKSRISHRKKMGVSGVRNIYDRNRGENQQAKFLERPAREKKTKILHTIAERSRL